MNLNLRNYVVTSRACMHDPKVFADPERFRPERYMKDGVLDATVRDPAAFTFGFGRRCVLTHSPTRQCYFD